MKIIHVLTLLILSNAAIQQTRAQDQTADLCKNLHTLLRFVTLEKPSDSLKKSSLRDSVLGKTGMISIVHDSKVNLTAFPDESSITDVDNKWAYRSKVADLDSDITQPPPPVMTEWIKQIVPCLVAEGYRKVKKEDENGLIMLDYVKKNIEVVVQYRYEESAVTLQIYYNK